MKELKALYEAPSMEVIELQMEQCIMSDSYGGLGAPGQGSGYNDGPDL